MTSASAVAGTDHEAEAVKAAADVITAQRHHLWDIDFCEVQALASAIIEAAKEHIAAAEREACARLAEEEAATLAASEGIGHRALRRFAALLRGGDAT